jgi:hypothetical protein
MVGTVGALKCTGERVFVLNESQTAYTVRRPSVGQSGITHAVEEFDKVEVETIEDNIIRELKEMVLKGRLQNSVLKQAREEDEASQPKEAGKLIEFAN